MTDLGQRERREEAKKEVRERNVGNNMSIDYLFYHFLPDLHHCLLLASGTGASGEACLCTRAQAAGTAERRIFRETQAQEKQVKPRGKGGECSFSHS